MIQIFKMSFKVKKKGPGEKPGKSIFLVSMTFDAVL